MHGERRSAMKSFILTAAVFMAVAAFSPRIAAAVGTPAGTVISNQATASYQDASANTFVTVSNTTLVTVDPVYSVAISTPADQSVPANTTAYYAYTLTNTGNATNTFNLTAGSVPVGWTVTLLRDDNANGTHEAGETTVIATTGPLAADAASLFFMAVAVPAGTPNGTTGATTLNVTGTGGAGEDDTTDAVTTTAQAPALAVVKDVRNVSTAGAFGAAANATPTQILEYRVTVTNNGSVAATSVVLSDPINTNTGFDTSFAPVFNAGSSGLTMATEYSNNNGTSWVYVPNPAGGCGTPAPVDSCVTDIRWRSTAGSMPSGGTTFNTLFHVRVK